MSKGVVIKLGLVGKFTGDNLNLVSKCKGKEFNVSKMIIKTHLTLKMKIFVDAVINFFY